MKLLAKLIIVIVVFIAGFYFGSQQALAPSDGATNSATNSQQTSEEIQVSLMLDFGNGQVRTYNSITLAKDSTAADLLEKVTSENNLELVKKDYGELGVFVESIGDTANDTRGDHYWQYWVNNVYAQIGASNSILNDGDIIEWKFIRGQIE